MLFPLRVCSTECAPPSVLQRDCLLKWAPSIRIQEAHSAVLCSEADDLDRVIDTQYLSSSVLKYTTILHLTIKQGTRTIVNFICHSSTTSFFRTHFVVELQTDITRFHSGLLVGVTFLPIGTSLHSPVPARCCAAIPAYRNTAIPQYRNTAIPAIPASIGHSISG